MNPLIGSAAKRSHGQMIASSGQETRVAVVTSVALGAIGSDSAAPSDPNQLEIVPFLLTDLTSTTGGIELKFLSSFMNSAPSEKLPLLVDFITEKCPDNLHILFTEFGKIKSLDRRRICFDILLKHPSLKELKLFCKGDEGPPFEIMKIGGIYYSREGLFNNPSCHISSQISLIQDLPDVFENFEGCFENGKPSEGNGVLIGFDSFQVFDGGLLRNKPDSFVKILDRNGNIFQGFYREGFPCHSIDEPNFTDAIGRTFFFQMNGHPKYGHLDEVTFKNGGRCKDLFNTCESIYRIGLQIRVGAFGNYEFPDGTAYFGDLKDFMPHGKGKRINTDRTTVYEGDFVEGEFDGQGTLTLSGGHQHVGSFKNNQPHGPGTLTYVDGYRITGMWIDGNRNGIFTGTTPDGQSHSFIYQDCKPFNGVFLNYYPDGTFELVKFISGQQVSLLTQSANKRLLEHSESSRD